MSKEEMKKRVAEQYPMLSNEKVDIFTNIYLFHYVENKKTLCK